ncbi:hypothetical protein [Microbispora amethystogenes]|uniref:DUF5666 domain-containing protein n=1 Tax=Microbispora amethystogenes TaxID=1427754 RepID=A0ABQ4FJA8_9ACTN|nr:hypothetical protein [Microbispora amethystogenes]GIH34904.1 hypothetical protein Mam01_50680 [Microbispora amethystogenes]
MTSPEFRGNAEEKPPTPPRGKRPRLLLGVAAALTLATGAGLAAANAPSDHTPSRAVQAQQPKEQPGPIKFNPAQFGLTELALLQQGQPQPGRPGQGDYQTFTSQTGAVDSVRSDSISVDGRAYAVDESTRIVADYKGLPGIQQGDQVWVIGTPGDSPRAVLIADASRPPLPGHAGGGPGAPSPPGAPGAPGAPGEAPEQSPGGSAPATPTETESPGTVTPTE